MSKSSNTSRRGLTLVEVVLGMFLLGTLLVAMLRSFNAQRIQIRRAGLQIEAAQAADELLVEWMAQASPIPLNQTGTWNDRWTWQTRLLRRTSVQSLPLKIIAVEIRSKERLSAEPLVVVEVADHAQELTP